jgi:hypothetical protein
MSSFSQSQWPSWAYEEVHDPFTSYSQYPAYTSYLADSMDAYQSNHHHLVHHQQMSRTTESKPRLSKEEVEILEAEFQKNHKPNSTIKKALAESMRVDNARINNWFQNRRAREKKERNIREYEARQKLEKDKTGTEPGDSFIHERKRELVASSAPFPTLHHGVSRSLTETPESSVAHGRDGEDSDLCDSVLPSTESPDGQSSGSVLIKTEPRADSRAMLHGAAPAGRVAQHQSSPGSRSGTLDDNDGDFALSNDEDGGSEFFTGQVNGVNNFDYLPHPHSQGDDSHVPSPSNNPDIASRRNRRPPMLSINSGSRSYSTGLIKTANDIGKRMDGNDSMRRVASATGSMRICKPMGLPRTPFFNRNGSDMAHVKQGPIMPIAKAAGAPPTPDTPILANQPGLGEACGQPDNESDVRGRIHASDLVAHDPTLRTPPTTPGAVDNFFSLNAVYDMSVQGDNMAAASGYNVPMSMSIPSYLAGASGSSSQPHTPSYQPQMTGYFGATNNSSEYRWPGDSESRSPGGNVGQGQGHFMNMTTSNYAHNMRR